MTLNRTQITEHRSQTEDKRVKRDRLSSGLLVLSSEEEHGGNIYRAAQELGIPENEIIDFSASINPLGLSEKVKKAIKNELDNLVNYPDSDSKALREKIAEHHGIDPETIICGNGSTELIYLIPRAFKPERVLIPAPTFSEYEKACKLSYELSVKSYELKKEDNFSIKPDEFINAMAGKSVNSSPVTRHTSRPCDMAFLCNPNNPTGHLISRAEVLRIAEAAKEMKCILVIDEAFIDFVPDESVIRDVQNNPYLIVLRSMTKFYALTGLRIGYGVFHNDLIGRIKEFKEPWTVNNLAQKAAVTAIDDSGYVDETFSLMKKEKEFLEKNFQELNVKYLPSNVNYYLLKTEDAAEMVSELRKKGILVRECSNFKGLDSSYIRAAVKSRKENEILLRELSGLFPYKR
jgi:threonine-phosphate decarboxylase